MKRLIICFIVIGCFLFASTASADDTIYACVKKNNGQIRIVSVDETCLPSETKVPWSIAGPAGPAGQQGPAGPKGDPGEPGSGGGIRVVDANGKYIGNFVGYYPVTLTGGSYPVLVTRQENGVQFLLTLQMGQVGGQVGGYSSDSARYFLDSSCSGPGYLHIDPEAVVKWGLSVKKFSGEVSVYYPVGTSIQQESRIYRLIMQRCISYDVPSYQLVEAGVVNLGVVVPPFRFGQ